jgi:hypothetical protein
VSASAPRRPQNLLAVGSRPSDFVEMTDLAKALADRGHRVVLLYLYSQSTPSEVEYVRGLPPTVGPAENPVAVHSVAYEAISQQTGAATERPKPGSTLTPSAKRKAKERAKPAAERKLLGRRIIAALKPHKHWIPTYFRHLRWRLLHLAQAEGFTSRFAFNLRGRNVTFRLPLRFMLSPLRAAVAVDMHRQQLRWYRTMHEFFQHYLLEHDIETVLIPEDIVGYVWPVLIRAGKDLGRPTLVFPYTLANELEPLRSLREQPEFQTRNNLLAALLCPSWRMAREGVDLVRLPSSHVFAHVAMGIAPPRPWMMNSGHADLICVDSRASFDYFRAGDIPAKRMRVTGSVSQDHLFARREAKAEGLRLLRRELGLVGEKPLLLLSGCPNQLAGPVPDCEFADMESIAAFVGACCAPLAEHYHLVVRPHPNYPEFGAMMERVGFASTMTATSRLVPICDLFIAFASATIRWAITAGVPTINYDVFRYDYGDFKTAPGVLSVAARETFESAVRSMLPGSAAYRAAAAAQASESARWGVMDGKCLDRIEASIIAVTASKRRQLLAAVS